MKNYRRIINEDLKNEILNRIKSRENACLSKYACRSENGFRRYNYKADDIRPAFARDTDRILHTRAYSRYIDKTQVFYMVDNEHITHRVLHVQMVSKIGRNIGRSLGLNEDLIEAIALGHDIGHVPFGHKGEEILSSLCIKHGIGRFRHNVESVNMLQYIEDQDLTLQVLDGILCHDGETHNKKLEPNRDKSWDDFDNEIKDLMDPTKNIETPSPMTLEGCVVRFSDTIAYLGRDLQDALEVKLLKNANDLPEKCKELLGKSNPEIINTLIIDLIENSYDTDCISFSDEVSAAVKEYREFNLKNIYKAETLKAGEEKIRRMFEILFEKFLDDLNCERKESQIYKDFIDLDWISQRYKEEASNEELVRDYIAGMTDRYFNSIFRKTMLIEKVESFE